VKWTIEPSQNPNLTSLDAGQVDSEDHNTKCTKLPTNQLLRAGIEASSPRSEDQVTDGLRVSKTKENQTTYVDSKSLEAKGEADHGAVGYPLLYA
jgi:hypothetical protein